MSFSSEVNWVKCLIQDCEAYVKTQFLHDTPLCVNHQMYDTTPSVTSDEDDEMFEMNDTTQLEFFERCKQLQQRVAEETFQLASSNFSSHSKMIRWNKKFEMCSNCDDVTTC